MFDFLWMKKELPNSTNLLQLLIQRLVAALSKTIKFGNFEKIKIKSQENHSHQICFILMSLVLLSYSLKTQNLNVLGI